MLILHIILGIMLALAGMGLCALAMGSMFSETFARRRWVRIVSIMFDPLLLVFKGEDYRQAHWAMMLLGGMICFALGLLLFFIEV